MLRGLEVSKHRKQMRERLGGCCKVFLLFLRGNSIFKVAEALACLGLFSCLTGEKTKDLGV